MGTITAKTLETLGRYNKKLKPETEKMLNVMNAGDDGGDMVFGENEQPPVQLPNIEWMSIGKKQTWDSGIVDLESQSSAAAAN